MKPNFFEEYTKNIPTFQEIQQGNLSDQERFINLQVPRIIGANSFADYGGFFEESNLRCSSFEGAFVEVRVADANHLLYSGGIYSGTLTLSQDFFHKLFKKDQEKPRFREIKPSKFYGEKGKTHKLIHVSCDIYPVLSLERTHLYKVDVSVEVNTKLPIKTTYKASTWPIANFIQKHFVVDKEGLVFETATKEALLQCLSLCKNLFLETKEKTIYVLKEENHR